MDENRIPEENNEQSGFDTFETDSGEKPIPEDVTTMQIDGFADEKKVEKNSVGKEIFEWVQAIVVAVVVAMFLRSFVFTMVRVDGSSMEPTLQHDQRLVVTRFDKNFEYGDVVIFRPVENPDRPYIKRVIATEGQTVTFDYANGLTIVDGVVLDEPYIMEAINYGCFGAYGIGPGKIKEAVVPENHLFVMGDNRNHSSDSRLASVGMVHEDSVIGKAVLRWWPLNEFGTEFKVEK